MKGNDRSRFTGRYIGQSHPHRWFSFASFASFARQKTGSDQKCPQMNSNVRK
jgi:hypothetical protein